MSPVGPSDRHAGKALAVAAVGVGLALGVALLVALLVNRGDVEVRLGDDRFDAGDVENRAESIARDGPIIFPDVALRGRKIYVQHLGATPDTGWLAFSAFDPNDDECLVDWRGDRGVFVSLCDDERTYPPDGTGLRQYPTEVIDGDLFVDLNFTERQAAEQDGG